MESIISEKKVPVEKIYYGATTIFYKVIEKEVVFLVIENTGTGNISFVSGAQEDMEESLEEVAQRENKEEIGIAPESYLLKRIDVAHKFVFGENKKERAGHRGIYQVFIADMTKLAGIISPTEEIKSLRRISEEEVVGALTFPDLVEVFRKTVIFIKKEMSV